MKRFKQNLSNYKLASCDMGQLIPVQLQEILPGDTMRLETSGFIRMSPMLAPVMHPVKVRFHHWFVPNRLVMDNWEEFITGGPDNQNADTIPTITIDDTPNTVTDYLGVPPVDGAQINALPVRAYNLIINEFYRDQDLQEERDLDDVSIFNVSWKKDYFTTARPWAQKGEQIYLPVGDTAPVTGTINGNGNPSFNTGGSISTFSGAGSVDVRFSSGTPIGTVAWQDPALSHNLVADLTQATGITPNQFREYFALQRYQEARAQYGSRYTEYLRYLGITPSDARLQRPEYIGGGKSTLQISEVLQTAQDDKGTEDTYVGTMRGHGIGATKTKASRKFFEEHGHVITLMSVIPDPIYQDGVCRNFLRQDKEDYFQKEFQSIGQQAVKQGEVYLDESTKNDVFGYSDRYSEYTNTPSTVSGEFRNVLDYWHLARQFETPPALNEDFIKCEPSKRIFAEQTQHSLWCMINNKTMARRMVRKTSIGRVM
jgi:hypothetical protein